MTEQAAPMGGIFRRRTNAWLALILAALVLVEAGILLLVRDGATRVVVSNALQALAAAIAAWSCFAALRRLRREEDDATAGWTLLVLGAGLFAGGQVAFALAEWSTHAVRYPNASDPLFLAGYGLLIAGFARLPREPLSRYERWNAALDFALLSLITGVAVWELSMRDLLTTMLAKSDPASVLPVVYTLLNTALLLMLYVRLVLSQGRGRLFIPNLLLVGAVLCMAIADLLMGRGVANSVVTSGSLVDIGWMLCAALAGFAGLYVADRGGDAEEVHGTVRRATWSTAVSYACLAGGAAVLVWSVGDSESIDYSLLAWATFGTLVLAAARQIRSARHAAVLTDGLEQARANLEAKVRERTSELEASARLLGESEAKHRVLWEMESDALVLVDNATGLILEANAAATALYGYARDELLARTNASLSAEPEDTARVTVGTPIPSDRITIPLRWHRKKDGNVFPVEITGRFFSWNGRGVHIAAIRDITERRRAEEVRVHRGRVLERVEQLAHFGSWEIELDSRTVLSSPEGHRIYGIPGESMTLAEVQGVVLPEYRAGLDAAFDAFLKGNAGYDTEFRIRRPTDGAIRDINSVAEFDPASRRITGFIRDITEQKQAESALRESRALLTNAFNNSPLLMTISDLPTGEYLEVNDSFCRVSGFGRAEAIGRTSWDLGWIGDAERARLLKEIELNGKVSALELTVHSKDGKPVVVRYWGDIIQSERGPRLFSTAEDITERKRTEAEKTRLETELQHSQKMESVGRLAGGVAHDFNNMLGVIIGHAEIALSEADHSHPLHEDLTAIHSAARRSADLTRQLLAFARKQTITRQVIDLNKVVEGMLSMLGRLIGEQIALAWQPGARLWQVRIDPSQLDQVLANLCVNSRDAITGVGKITIDTSNVVIGEEDAVAHPAVAPGAYVRLAVADDGCGMDEDELGHIFEPFFTTKDVGEGTGLGLATVYGAVKQNDGFIEVDSRVGHGSTFALYLPRHQGTLEAGLEAGRQGPVLRGSENILLVEDDPAVLALTTRLLKRQGYTVVPAGTPGQAVERLRAFPGEVHLLVTDVIMPEKNGRELAGDLLAIEPRLKTLFMSGYPADVIARGGVLDHGVDFIAKPFSPGDLAAKVRAVLDRTS